MGIFVIVFVNKINPGVFKNCHFTGHALLVWIRKEKRKDQIQSTAALYHMKYHISEIQIYTVCAQIWVSFTSRAAIQSPLPQCIDPELRLGK